MKALQPSQPPALYPLKKAWLDRVNITKEDILMKRYLTPEMNMIMVVHEDVLTISNGGENGDLLVADYGRFFPTRE